jgi:hypothetical protein
MANSAISGGYTPENTSLIQQVENNPTSVASDPNQSAAYTAQLNDQYTGPTSWQDTTNNGTTVGGYGTLQGEVANAQQGANMSAPGMANVAIQNVEQQMNPGQTSQGVNALDTLLFTDNPGGMQAAQTAAAPYAGLTDYLNNANTGITGNIANAQSAAAQTAADALAGGTGAITNINNAVTGTTATDLANAQAEQAQLNKDIANLYGGQALQTAGTTLGTYGGGTTPWGNTTNYTVGQLSPQDLQAMGITQDQWNALQGAMQSAGTSTYETGHNFGAGSETGQTNIGSYLNMQDPTTLINNADVGTAQQYADTAALNQLMGAQAPLQGEALNPAMAKLAGAYKPGMENSFNYNAALSDTQNFENQAIAQAQQEAQAISGAADLAHAQSQHTGGVLGGLVQDITHPLSTIGSVFNPTSWGANIENVASGKQVNPTNENPMSPTSKSQLAHGGEVQDLNKYLDSKKVK